jgi:hypothetical protein
VSLPFVLRVEAVAEFDDAFDFYDRQRIGLGPEFAAEVQRTFDRIISKPDLHPCVFSDIRKSAVRRFPYNVFDPSVWQGRV